MDIKHLTNIFKSKDPRNRALRNNILFTGILKVISLASSFLIVPITLHYLNNEIYGVWLTITAILFWFSIFDVGLGNGMRNYLTQSISSNQMEKGRAYISTTLILLALIAVTVGALCVIPFSLVDFNKVFNTGTLSNFELRNALAIAVCFTLARLVVNNVGTVFIALQKYALNDLLATLGNVLGLILIYIITKTTAPGNLLYVVLALTATPVMVYIVAAFPIFIKYPQLRPGLNYFDHTLIKQIAGKGLGFFLIQMTSCLVIYGGSNIFITQYCGPAAVTTYNIAYKFFNLLIIAYTIVISPLWNAYTDAYVKGDKAWIASTFQKTLKIWGLTVALGGLMFACSNLFYYLWVGKSVSVPWTVSLCVWLYVSLFNLNNCATYLINGLNKIRIQVLTSILLTGAYLLVVFFMGKRLGIEGVVLCMAGSYLVMVIFHMYQCRLLINGKATGIWNQ